MIELITADQLSEADRIDFYARRYTKDKLQIILLHSGSIIIFDQTHEPVARINSPPEALRDLLAQSLISYAEWCARTERRRKARESVEGLEIELEEDGFITVNL